MATLPLSWRRVGAEHGCPQGKALLVFIMVVGYIWVWVVSGFLGKWGGERERKKTFKIFFFSLPLHAQGRRRTVPFKTALFQCSVFFFFLNVIWKEPKNRL